MARLKDIAERAGVSVPTVSKILNPDFTARIAGDNTVAMVRKIAAELNYSPNASARALVTRRTHSIGVMWDKRMDSPEETVFWSDVMRGIMSACHNANYECMVSVEDYRTKKGFDLPRGFREKYADGVIVTYPLDDTEKIIQQKLIDSHLPFVTIWTPERDESIWSVHADFSMGYRQALLHLYELGHRRIGYCVYPEQQLGSYHTSPELEKTVEEEFGIRLVPLEVDLTKYSHREYGHLLAQRLMDGDLDITAMLMGDIISQEAMRVLRKNGWRLPRDFSVVGLNDTYVCQCSEPPMTSIVLPVKQLGEKAVQLLLENIKAKLMGVSLKPRHESVMLGFTLRESTGPVSRKKKGRRK